MKMRQRKRATSPTPPYVGPSPEEIEQARLRAEKAREMLRPDQIIATVIARFAEAMRKANEHFAAKANRTKEDA